MDNNDFTNHVALNQTLFRKSLLIGKGFQEGTRTSASENPRGYYLWVNGLHKMPKADDILEMVEIGSIEYDHLLNGMGDCSGTIKYWLAKTKWEFLLIAGVNLNSQIIDDSHFIKDIATLVFRDRVPFELRDDDAEISGDLLLAHFTQFIGLTNESEFRNAITNNPNNFISSVIDYYFENQDDEYYTINDTLDDEFDFGDIDDDEE